jgi:hypothetical protein
MNELTGNYTVKQSLGPGTAAGAAMTATTKGTGVDLAAIATGGTVEEIATVTLALGTWGDGTHTFTLQESVDDVDGDYADVASGDLNAESGVLGGAGSNAVVVSDNTKNGTTLLITYAGSKRWLRVVNTVSGGPAVGLRAVASVLILKRYAGVTPGGSNAAFN